MAKGKKSSGKNYASKGERRNVVNGKQSSGDVSHLDTVSNKMKAFKKGKLVWLTVPNPNTNETNKKFIRVKASEVWTKTGPYLPAKVSH